MAQNRKIDLYALQAGAGPNGGHAFALWGSTTEHNTCKAAKAAFVKESGLPSHEVIARISKDQQTPRFTVEKSAETMGSRPAWWIKDTTNGSFFAGHYDKRRHADVICRRWNADHALAMAETGRPREASPSTGFPQPLNPADYAHLTTRTNMMRAEEGKALCEKMRELTGTDTLAEQVGDVITQLMHLCRLMKDENSETVDFEDCLRTARMNFEAEIEEEPDF